MRFDDRYKRNVFFIGLNLGHRVVYKGSCFLLAVPSSEPNFNHEYLVTARHVLEDLDDDLDTFIQGVDRNGDSMRLDFKVSNWFSHEEHDVDVAVLPILGLANKFEGAAFDVNALLTPELEEKHGIGIGDEVVMPGLFTRLSTTLDPIIRVGNLAMKPRGKVVHGVLGGKRVLMEGILVDQRSIGGMSGGPAYVRETVSIKNMKWPDGAERAVHGLGLQYLLGLVRGHWTVDEQDANEADPDVGDYPIGMVIVIPATKILETLAQPKVRHKRKEVEALVRAERASKHDR